MYVMKLKSSMNQHSVLSRGLQQEIHTEEIKDDYLELIELTMFVLGSQPATIPGRIHHARWMAKLLYAIKNLRLL